MLAISDNYKINPEVLDFLHIYMSTLDLEDTCNQLSIPTEMGQEMLNKKESKRFLDSVFLEQGYMNRFKIVELMNKAIASKIEEAEESQMFGKESIMEMLKFMHQMRMDEAKMKQSTQKVTNVQNNNYGSNLGSLLDKIAR